MQKTAVLLSGGVDSSVALKLVIDQGYPDITAYYLKIWLEDELSFLGECPWEEDLSYARKVCSQLNIPLKIVPLQQEYHKRVVSYVLEELKSGYTPSPDIFCNSRIKFGAFLEYLDDEDTVIITGHYGFVKKGRLFRAADKIKDQTYFLSHLNSSQLNRIYLPLGKYPKADIRRLADEFDLATKNRKDSQGICFLGKIKYSDFVKFHFGEKMGEIVNIETNEKIGEHSGFWFYTIGQRTGLGLGNGPWFVYSKNTAANTVYVVHKSVQDNYSKNSFYLDTPFLIHPVSLTETEGLTVKLRHGPELIPAEVLQEESKLLVKLKVNDNGIAPGQFCVFYKNQECLGQGKILGNRFIS